MSSGSFYSVILANYQKIFLVVNIYLIYNVVLVSGVQKSDLFIYVFSDYFSL